MSWVRTTKLNVGEAVRIEREVRTLPKADGKHKDVVTQEMIGAGKRVFAIWGEGAVFCDHFLGSILTEAFEAMDRAREIQPQAATRHARTAPASKGHPSPVGNVS